MRRARSVGIEPVDHRIREDFCERLFDLFGAEPARLQVVGSAGGTARRQRRVVAAVVAAQRTVAFVVGQRHVTIGTRGGPAAVSALDERGKPAPVLEQHHLPPPHEGLLYAVEQQFIEMGAFLAAPGSPQGIGQQHLRQRYAAVTFRERHQYIFAAKRIVVRLHRRRRTAEQCFGSAESRQHDRRIAGLIARRAVGLLEAVLMLLIHDNQRQVRQRQQD